MTSIVDRRHDESDESDVNRQRFMRRYNNQIKRAVKEAIKNINVKDSGSNEVDVTVKRGTLDDPHFEYDKNAGSDKKVFGLNKKWSRGDTVRKPTEGGAGRGGPGSKSSDEFTFKLTKDEFKELFFDDLELPNFIKKSLTEGKISRYYKAGTTNAGMPNLLNIIRTFRVAIARELATIAQIKYEAEIEFEEAARALILEEIKDIPPLIEADLRYFYLEKTPEQNKKAVIFCLMDVSGSMGELEKDIAKRFFMLLYMFLEHNYEEVVIRFIRHTDTAKEVEEEEFFYGRESGGTVISSGLALIHKIISEEYTEDYWNIYIAQASDGDNWMDDMNRCVELLNSLLSKIQYYSYIEVGRASVINRTSFLRMMEALSEKNPIVQAKIVHSYSQIYKVFMELFNKKRRQNEK